MTQANIARFIAQLTQNAQQLRFEDSMAIIDENFEFTPSAFKNGQQSNAVGENSGSCKVFSFAQIQGLNQQQTLSLFGQYYRDVVATPDAEDHQNIRQFMLTGWNGVKFSQVALSSK